MKAISFRLRHILFIVLALCGVVLVAPGVQAKGLITRWNPPKPIIIGVGPLEYVDELGRIIRCENIYDGCRYGLVVGYLDHLGNRVYYNTDGGQSGQL